MIDVVQVQPPTVIQPPSRWPGLGLTEAWRYRSLCLVLAHRLLKVRYRQSIVGVGWAVGQPVLLMIVFTIFFGLFARVDTQGVSFAVFYFSGLVLWQMVSKVLAEGTSAVVGNASLIDRVYFPRIYLPIAVGIASLVDLACTLGALLALMLVSGYLPGWGVLELPGYIAVAFATCLGASFWLGALNVSYRDVSLLLPVLTQLWFFASPIIYPASLVPDAFQHLYYLNPIALAVTGLRTALFHTPGPPPGAWLEGVLVATFVLVSGYFVFRNRQSNFADVV